MRFPPVTAAVIGRLWPAFALIAAFLVLAPAFAQAQGGGNGGLLGAPAAGMISPNTNVFGPGNALGTPGESLIMPGAPGAMPMVPAGQVALALGARFGKDAAPISGGLDWRVYAAKPDASGAFKLVREDKGPSPTIVLPAAPTSCTQSSSRAVRAS